MQVQIWPKSRGLGCVTSAPAADENRDAGFTRFRVEPSNIDAICVSKVSYVMVLKNAESQDVRSEAAPGGLVA